MRSAYAPTKIKHSVASSPTVTASLSSSAVSFCTIPGVTSPITAAPISASAATIKTPQCSRAILISRQAIFIATPPP